MLDRKSGHIEHLPLKTARKYVFVLTTRHLSPAITSRKDKNDMKCAGFIFKAFIALLSPHK